MDNVCSPESVLVFYPSCEDGHHQICNPYIIPFMQETLGAEYFVGSMFGPAGIKILPK